MILNQSYLFLIFTINGIIIGLLFDVFRILRRTFKTSDIVTYFQDILFWLLTGFILLYSIFAFSNGEIRFYMFLGAFLGCLIYMLALSKTFIKVNVRIVLALKNIIGKILSIIFLPIQIIIKIFKKIFLKPIKFITINISKIQLKGQKNLKKLFKTKKDEIKT